MDIVVRFGYCVLLTKEAAHMNDYMKALHQRFFREPEDTEEEQETEQAEQALKATLDREQRKLLLELVNAQSLWQGRLSLESFIAGFRLALGIAGELEPYSFDDDMEERARQIAEGTLVNNSSSKEV